jgi:hypothetical protein
VRTLASGLARENFGLAVVADGAILVADAAARRVVRVGPGARRSIAANSTAPWFPTGVAATRGALYLLEATDYVRGSLTRLRVRRIDAGGASQILAKVTIPPA